MGNTNIPQGGAAHVKNSHDTRSGVNQLSDEQKQQQALRDQQSPDPAVSMDEALGGHVGTGHSPSDAT